MGERNRRASTSQRFDPAVQALLERIRTMGRLPRAVRERALARSACGARGADLCDREAALQDVGAPG